MTAFGPARQNGIVVLAKLVAWAAIVLVAAIVAAAVVAPRIAGATPYAVLSASMTPTLPAGSLVVVRPSDPEELGIGDVVTYQLRSGEPQTATHRIVAVRQRLDGHREFVTQGDANASPDPFPVRPVQVRGAVWYSMPYVGHAHRVMSPAQRQAAVGIVVVLLLGYAGLMFVGAASERRGRGARR